MKPSAGAIGPVSPWKADPMRCPFRKNLTYPALRSRSTVTKQCAAVDSAMCERPTEGSMDGGSGAGSEEWDVRGALAAPEGVGGRSIGECGLLLYHYQFMVLNGYRCMVSNVFISHQGGGSRLPTYVAR